jgi:hypothetical protein
MLASGFFELVGLRFTILRQCPAFLLNMHT